jgi:DNA repair protein RadC
MNDSDRNEPMTMAPSKFREDATALRRRLIEAAEMIDRVVALECDAQTLLLTQTSEVVNYVIMRYGRSDQEVVGCVYANARNRLIADVELFRGTIASAAAEPRVFLRKALEWAATSMVVWHTHTSGNPEPSAEDLIFTSRLVKAADLVGVRVLDHLIIGNAERWVSLRKSGDLKRGLA